ncbi:hypothetical protein VPH35_073526 [Triticum aestivum]
MQESPASFVSTGTSCTCLPLPRACPCPRPRYSRRTSTCRSTMAATTDFFNAYQLFDLMSSRLQGKFISIQSRDWFAILLILCFVDAGARHTNTSMCTRSTEGDAPQLTPREADFQRDTQDSKPALLGPETPHAREGPRLGAAMGCPRST